MWYFDDLLVVAPSRDCGHGAQDHEWWCTLSTSRHDIAFDEVYELIGSRHFVSAFVHLLAIGEDLTRSSTDRAVAWSRMGQLGLECPDLLVRDMSGLWYQLIALRIDPGCLEAWFQVVQDYGAEPTTHHRADLYEQGVRMLTGHWSTVPADWRRIVLDRLSSYPVPGVHPKDI